MDEDSLPSCPVCMDGFNDPRLLQCGHSICFDCVRKIKLQHGLLPCPMCKQAFNCPSFDSLPKNYSLLETIELLKSLSDQQKQKEEVQKKKCSQHAGQELDLICITCKDLPVCAKCLLVGTHKGHDHIAVEEYDSTMKKKALLREKRKILSSRLKPLSESYNTVHNTVNQIITRLKECSINMEAQKQVFTVLESELENVNETEVETFENTLKEVEIRLKELTTQHKTVFIGLGDQFLTLKKETEAFQQLSDLPSPSPSPSLSPSPAPTSTSTSSASLPPSHFSSSFPSTSPSPSPSPSHTSPRITSTTSSAHSPLPSPSLSPAHAVVSNANIVSANANLVSQSAAQQSVRSSAQSPAVTSSSAAPVDNAERIFIVGGMNLTPFDAVLVHKQGAWSEIAPLSAKRNNLSAIFEGSSLYVVGGVDESGILNTMLKYDLNERIWRNMPNMMYKRSALSTVVFQNNIWAIGGSDGENSLDSVEVYNLAQKRWTRTTNMPYARNFHASVVTNEGGGFVFTLGGSIGMERTKTAASCDHVSNRWTQIAPMSTARSGLASVAIGKSIYALGGFDGKQRLSSVEVYRMDEGRWSALPNMGLPRVWFGAVTMNDGNICVLGGFDGKTRLKSVEVFDPRAGRWELSQDMSLPYPVSGFGCTKS